MSVRWEEDRERYIVDYYPDGRRGKRVRLTLPASVRDQSAAEAIERDLRNPSENSEIHADNHSTVKDLFPAYLEYCELHRDASTYDNIKWTWDRKFCPHLGHLKVSEIDKAHTTIYKRIRKLDGVKNRTVNKEMSYFMGFLTWCRKEKNIELKAFGYERLKQERTIKHVLSLEETIRLVLNADLLYRVFFLTLYALGLRFNECTGLRWEDFDPENKAVIIHGKGSKQRLLPVSDWVIYALEVIKPKLPPGREAEPPKGLIFRSRVTGGKIVNLTTAINRACRKAGIEKHVHPHLLRHSIATHFMAWGINIKIVQMWLGHSQESTTADMYMHAELNHLRQAQHFLDGQLENHFTQADFQPEPERVKRPYTMTEKALRQRREVVPRARAARKMTINSQRKKTTTDYK